MSGLHVIYPPDTKEELILKAEIDAIYREYKKAIQPYIDKLVAIQATKIPTYVYLPEPPENDPQ